MYSLRAILIERKITIFTIAGIWLLATVPALANDNSDIRAWRKDPLQLNVTFDRYIQPDYEARTYESPQQASKQPRLSHKNILQEYDATFFYPFRKGIVNFDLGVNLRFMNVQQNANEGQTSQQDDIFNETLPMFYTSVLFDLPVHGFSAGLEGRHFNLNDNLAYDYRAKLRYQWNNGFGVQGGWQYQYLSLDRFEAVNSQFEAAGPYMDLYFNF